jgi:hypothetical protein
VHVVLHVVILARGGGNIAELHFCGALQVLGHDFQGEKLRFNLYWLYGFAKIIVL